MAIKSYTVLTAVEHGSTAENHARYEPGDTIELDDKKEAPALLAVGAIEGPAEAKAAGKK